MAERLLIGIGNPYRSDDGVGSEVVDALAGSLPSDVRLLRSDGDPASLLAAWAGSPLTVVVDAVVSRGKPGTIYRFNGRDRLPTSFFSHSTHLLGLPDAVDLARSLDKLPEELLIIGVEAADFSHGRGLSPAVAAAVARVTDLVKRIFTAHDHRSASSLGAGRA